MKKVMNHLISPAQTAYISGRFIGENSRLIYDVIEHANSVPVSGVIMAVDFEAAFDTVSWSFLTEALAVYNFGSFFIKMIKAFYLNSNNFSRILLEGHLGSKIHMERGIRQGDPVSGYLFNMVMEPLTNQMLQSKTIAGIRMEGDREIRLSQYADDLVIFSKAEVSPIKGVLNELDKFSDVSGLRINVEKTKCLKIGQNIETPFLNDIGLSVVNELKVLGIIYSSSTNDIVARNMQAILPRVSQEITQWKRRNLTLIGKITVVKAMLISKMVHVFSTLPNPSDENISIINNL